MFEKRKLRYLSEKLPEFECPKQCCSRCCGPVLMTSTEYWAIRAYLKKMPCDELLERKTVSFVSTKVSLDCSLLGKRGKCLVYPVRPMVCRMFGSFEGLRCPYDDRSEARLLTLHATLRSFLKGVRYFDLKSLLEGI